MIDISRNIGTKFNADGSVRFFPGNTVISFLEHDTKAWNCFTRIRSMLTDCAASRCATLMPDTSIHMTVFEGVCHYNRRPQAWFGDLPLDLPLEKADDVFAVPLLRVELAFDL